MAERRGLLDTSAVIDLERAIDSTLPIESSVATLTLAELQAGVRHSPDERSRSARQARLGWLRDHLLVVPFDDAAARAYADVHAATLAAGRRARGARAVDLLIAATALANDLPLHTRNAADVDHLADVMRIVEVRLA